MLTDKILSDLRVMFEYGIKRASIHCWEDVPQCRFNAERAEEIVDDLTEAALDLILEIIAETDKERRPSTKGRKTLRANNSSGYRGVTPHDQKWVAWCYRKYIGIFDTAEEAAIAYDRAIIERLGARAILNFPKLVEK